MTIRFFCTCGQKLKAPESKIGKHYDCPICGETVTVPEGSDPAARKSGEGLTEELASGPAEHASSEWHGSSGSGDNHGGVAVAPARAAQQRSETTPVSAELSTAREPSASPPVSTASVAHDLLTRRMAKDRDERRSPAPEPLPSAEDEEGIDYAALAQELARTLLPGLAAIVLLCTVVYWISSSVMSTRALPDLGSVSGVVKLDGAPLKGAVVTFQPVLSEEPGSKLSSSVGTTDEEGSYTLMYVRDVDGAAVGKHKVFVQAALPNGKELIPYRYNLNTELTADVESGSNEFDFDLESKSK